MNSIAEGLEPATLRRQQSARDALERLLDAGATGHRARATAMVRQAGSVNPGYSERLHRIEAERAQVQRIAGVVAAGGALVAVAVVMMVSAAPLAAGMQALLIGGAALAIGMFALLLQVDGPPAGPQLLLQGLATVLLAGGTGLEPFGLGVAALGWAAACARGWLQARHRALDLATMELALKAAGAGQRLTEMRRRQAAAI